MKLLIALAITSDNAAAAEKLIDYIRGLSGKRGHLVLAMMSNVHDENKARIRISAELAFDAVHEVGILPLADSMAPKSAQFNNVFNQVAKHIAKTFQWPFLWLDVNCTPAHPHWMTKLSDAYDAQPHPFFGSRMLMKLKGPEPKDLYFMAEVGIYPANAENTMIHQVASVTPINVENAARVLEKLGMTKMIQQANISSEGDLISVRDDAVLVTGDKAGLLRAQVMANAISSSKVIMGPVFSDPDPEPVKVHVAPDPLIDRLTNGLKQNGKAARR